jgi:hypothetical protein
MPFFAAKMLMFLLNQTVKSSQGRIAPGGHALIRPKSRCVLVVRGEGADSQQS